MAGESKQIYQLTTKEFDGNVLVPFDTPNTDPSTQAQKPYVSGKASGDAVADFIANTEEYATDLDTEAKTITGAINELHAINGYSYDAYDPTTAYAKNDLCIYNNVLYKAKQATTGNLPTNTTYWEPTSIADEIGRIDTALSGKQNNLSLGSLTNTDLDTLRNNGYYYLAGLSSTHHAPCSYGILEVISTTVTLQRVTQVGPTGTSATQYERIYINSAWTTWRTITRS